MERLYYDRVLSYGPRVDKLDADIVKYLLDNPNEVERIRRQMCAEDETARWRTEIAEKRKNAKMVPCGTYGCTQPRNEMDVMCESCFEDYKRDPDAFK